MLFNRILRRLALVFGFLGVAACIVGWYAALSLRSRLERVNDRVFARIDMGLASAQTRARSVQARVEESKITCTELEQSLRDWGTKRTIEGLGARLEIDSRVEQLAGHLQMADSWLEISAESIRSLQHVVALGNSLGTLLDPAFIEGVLEKITSLRSTLKQTEQAIDEIREFNANNEGETEENRLSRVARFLGRVVVTIGDIDTRLGEYATQLSELQTVACQWKTTASRYILLSTIGCYMLLAWIAAGQVALCLWGWTICRPRRSSG